MVRRRVKNSGRKGRKYTGSSDGSRVERRAKRKITGYKLETTGLRKKRRYQRMGAGRLSKLTRGGKRGSSDRESDSRESGTYEYTFQLMDDNLHLVVETKKQKSNISDDIK